MLQRIREILTLALLALLPFHAFLVTIGTRVIQGPGHAPMSALAVWKEGLLAVILLLAFIEIIARFGDKLLESFFDGMDLCILGLLAIAAVLQYHAPVSLPSFAYGFKYDFIPLLAFLLLRRLPWSDVFRAWVPTVVIFAGSLIALEGLATLFVPDAFFTWLGYSDAHSLYQPNGPLAAFQKIGGPDGLRRMQATLSGPNQLGLWMLFPLAACFATWKKGKSMSRLVIVLLIGLAILFSFSRSAWLGAAVVTMLSIMLLTSGMIREKLLLAGFSCAVVAVAAVVVLFPQALNRAVSNKDHLQRPLAAIAAIVRNPLGMGLGSVGPAANRTSDACVYLEEGPLDWLQPNESTLCVFVGGEQVVPAVHERTCHCAFLPENWYLQIGVELGVTGMALWLILTGLGLIRSFSLFGTSPTHRIAALSFAALALASLFLHAFEDSAVAYTAWIMLAMSLQQRPRNERFLF